MPTISRGNIVRHFVSGVIFLCFVWPVCAGADPDFSGSWKLQEQRSVIRTLPIAPQTILKIEHRDCVVRCFAEPDSALVCQTRTDGKEMTHRLGDFERRSMAKWEGDSLLINTIAIGAKMNFTEMDRWKVSRDGKRLTIRREIVSTHGGLESTLVYDKQ